MLHTPAAGHAFLFCGAQRCTNFASTAAALLPCFCLQTKGGKEAKGPTAEEFKDFLLELQRRIAQILGEPVAIASWLKRTGGTPTTHPPIFSMDNPSIHDSAVEVHIGKQWGNRFSLPVQSPDIHRVVERTHGRICSLFRDWLFETHEKLTPKQYAEKLQQIFHSTQWPDVFQNDLKTYPEMLQAVIDKEGAWPEKKFR